MADESNKSKQILDGIQGRIEDLKIQLQAEKAENERLKNNLEQKNAELTNALRRVSDLETECDNLTTKGILSATEARRKRSKQGLTKMVQEIDKCLALLNQA